MVGAIEVGFRIGAQRPDDVSGETMSQITTIQSSLLGILALMLGFTFAIALDRFNSRSLAVVDEANAIGTAYLRSSLLPEPIRGQAISAFREYVDLRVQASTIPLNRYAEWEALLEKAGEVQEKLWGYAMEASTQAPNPATTGLFVQAVNDMIDADGRRIAELNRHVPELVLFLLYGAFIFTGGIIGYTAGLSGRRPARATYIMMCLIVLLIFMVTDLDRPRRGFIQVSQQSLLDTATMIRAHEDAEPSSDIKTP